MKAKWFLLAGLSAMMLGACSSDDDVITNPEKNPMIEGEGVMNLKLMFAEDVMSRAWGGEEENTDFANGEGDESKVRQVDVYYFENKKDNDAEEIFLGKRSATVSIEGPGEIPNIEKTITAVVPATVVNKLLDGEGATANIVVVLNGEKFTATLTENQSTFTDFNKAFKPDDNAKAGFMMSNSTYYPSNKETFFQEITRENVAEKGSNPTPVEVFVERVCSKVTLSKGAEMTAPNGVTFEAKGWGLNIRNSSFFPVKKLSTLFTGLEEWPGKDDWTNAEAVKKHRSYWAYDTNYDTDGSFIKTQFAKLTTKLGSSEYCLENTMNYDRQRLPQTTTAVVYAQYLPKMYDGGEGSDPINSNRKSWVLKDGLYYSLSTFVNNFLGTEELYVIAEQTESQTTYKLATVADVTFSYNEVTIDNNIVGATDYTFAKKGETVLYKKQGEEYQPYEDYAALNKAFGDYKQGASIYIDGYCYYEIPIRHFNDKELGALEAEWNGTYTQKHLGRYGIVRNHAYQLTINSVSKPGKPIEGVDIVPNDDPDDPTKEYSMIVSINVLSWAVRNQGVDL